MRPEKLQRRSYVAAVACVPARYLVANGARADQAGALWNYDHSDHYVRAVQSTPT